MSNKLYEDIESIYQNIDEDFTEEELEFATEVITNLISCMLSEGYSHKAIINFMERVESYEEIVDRIENSNIVENSISEEYIEEQLELLFERRFFRDIWNFGSRVINKVRGSKAVRGFFGRPPVQGPVKPPVQGPKPKPTVVSKVKDKVSTVLKNPTVNKVGKAALVTGGAALALKGISDLTKGSGSSDSSSDSSSGSGSGGGSGSGSGSGSSTTTSGGDKKPTPMQQWAKANPKLAAAAREKERIRGTSETDNPLMKGMRSNMPKPKVAQDTENEKYGKGLPKVSELGKGHQSLTNNPNVKQKETKKEAYDYVLDYLFETGQAETVAEANNIMLGMDDKSIYEIVLESSCGSHSKKKKKKK